MLINSKPSRYLLLMLICFFFRLDAAVANPSSHFKQNLISQYSEDMSQYFASPILEDAIREKLGLSDSEPLTRKQLSKITSLKIDFTNLSRLDGIEYLTNLKKLNLSHNQISDLTPLVKLTSLIDLKLDSNQISDLSPLTRLTNLKLLWLASNQISDLSPLSKLNNLRFLNLKNNLIKNFTPVRNIAKECVGCEISAQKL